MRKMWLSVAVAIAATGALIPAVFALRSGHPADRPSPSRSAVQPGPSNEYADAVDAAHQHGLHVWIESDLVKAWLAGKDSFHAAVATIAGLAARPGVIGIKIADEIGYHDGLDSATKIRSFLADSAAALHAAAPGTRVLIDMVVPELGCLPGYDPPLRWATICAAQQRGRYPQLTLDAIDTYLHAHTIDVLDLSTDLLTDNTYSGWGVDANTAQHTAWDEVHRRGWDQLVVLQARKALAHPGGYPGTATDAQAALTTFVDIPRTQGAAAVDVWTWRQLYQGQVYRLLDPGLQSNKLWVALEARRATGAHLFTHLSPHSVEEGLEADLRVLARVFTDLFVAAGTG
jgi:hypothetical protein